MKVARAKTEYMCLNGTPLGSGCNLPSCQRCSEFKYLGSTLQSDGDMSTEINKRTQLEEDVERSMRYKESETTSTI